MAQAPSYNRSTEFADDERDNIGGRSTVRTDRVDAELDAVSTSVNALRANQLLNQRDDGEIRDRRVKLFTLATDVLALIGTSGSVPRGDWATATSYALADVVVGPDSGTYICSLAHTSGVFADDLAAVKWILIAEKTLFVTGAVGDGVEDDTAAIQAAVAYATSSGLRIIQLGGGTYRLTEPLLLNSAGLQLRGVGPSQTTLLIDHTLGAGVNISASYCGIADLSIEASPTRAAYTTGGTYDFQSTLHGMQMWAGSGLYASACSIDRVWSFDHPGHGFYLGGYCVDTRMVQCAAYANRGDGFFGDDGTLAGGASNRNGQIILDTCRALDNGGSALHIDCSTGPTYRWLVTNFETIWNCWNTGLAGRQNAEFRIGGENHVIMMSAQSPGPGGHTRTTGITGRPRLAAATVADGIYIGSNTGSITLIENRFIRTAKGVKTAATVSALHLRVLGAYFTQQEPAGVPTNQTFGFDIGSGYQGLEISVQAGQPVDFMVYTPTQGGTCRIGNVEGLVYGGTTGSVFRRSTGYVNATISSNAVNAQSRNVSLLAASPTTLVAIQFAGGSNPLPPGEVIHFQNTSGHTITLQHGTSPGYIRTKSGANVTVLDGARFSVVTDPSGNPYEL